MFSELRSIHSQWKKSKNMQEDTQTKSSFPPPLTPKEFRMTSSVLEANDRGI